MKTIRSAAAAILVGLASLASAQTPTALPDLDLWNHGAVFNAAQEDSGDLLIGGLFSLAGGLPRANIARVLLPEGEFDPNFAPDVDGPVFNIHQLDDGKIIIGGSFARVNGAVRNNIARLNADGSLDTTWNPGADDPVFIVASDGPDHVIIGGTFTEVGGQTRRGLARVAIDGAAVDASWNPDVRGGGVFTLARGSGDFWIGGNFNEVGGNATQSLARLNAAGMLVTAHSVDGNVESLSFDPVDGLYFCGRFSTADSQPRSRIARLDLDGNLDSFSVAVDQNVNDCRVANGQILIGGQFTSVNGIGVKGVARLSPAGIVDAGFQPAVGGVFAGTAGTDALVWTARELGDGRVFAGGVFRNVDGLPRAGAALLDDLDGQVLDPIDVEQPGEIRTVLSLDDGAMLVGGRFRRSGDTLRANLARIQPDGNLDLQWELPINGEVLSGDLLDDGTVAFGGFFSAADGEPRNNLVRLVLDDGPQVQDGWNPGTNGPVLVIEQDRLDPDRVYVAGSFTEIQTDQVDARSAMARLSLADDGSPDDFDPNFNNQVNDLLQLQSSSRILVAGVFSAASGQPHRGVAAFVDTGAQTQLDPTFDAASDGNLWVLKATADGESFFAGGEFSTLFGQARTRLAKIGPDLEPFGQWTPSATSGTPIAMALDGDGGLFVGGNFGNLNGSPRARLGRLSIDTGTLDAMFNPGADPGIVWQLGVDPGRLLVAGSFQQAGGLARSGLAAFNLDLLFSDGFEPSVSADTLRNVRPDTATVCQYQVNRTPPANRAPFIRAPGCDSQR